jgi:Na+-driven multidrug efflux pump
VSTSPPPSGVGRGLFWAGLLAFALVDLAMLGGLHRAVASAPQLLAYALIAAFALALAYTTAVASLAIGRRKVPPLGDALRAGLLLVLAAGHLALIARVKMTG